MKLHRQAGFISSTLTALIVAVVLLVAALIFGGWAFASRSDYKNNSDQKAAKTADTRQKITEAVDAAKYAEEAKNPLKIHKAPDQFGGVTVQYPKTWSGYVDESGDGTTPVDDYFQPDVVPSTSNRSAVYALRIRVVSQTYDSVLQSYKTAVDTGKLAATPYALPKVPSVVGTRLTGQVDTDKQGSLIIVPIRNLTLKIWTESVGYFPDFNNIILPNLTFAP